jgi:hypothetical protein
MDCVYSMETLRVASLSSRYTSNLYVQKLSLI